MKRGRSAPVLSHQAARMLQSGGTTAPRIYTNKQPQQPIGKAMARGQRAKVTSPGKRKR